jgi:uncharacterized ion transporter superfamily protein YfcC
MIIIGAQIGVMASTVNPFSIGVAAGEAGVSIGDGIVLRGILWVVLTAMSVAWVLRYAARIRKDPAASLVGWDAASDDANEADASAAHPTAAAPGHAETGEQNRLTST